MKKELMKYRVSILVLLFIIGINFSYGQSIPKSDTLVYEDDDEWLAEINQLITSLDDIESVSDMQVTCGKENDMVTTHGFAIRDNCDQQYYIPFHAITNVDDSGSRITIEANNGQYSDYKYPFLKYKGGNKDEFYTFRVYFNSNSSRVIFRDSLHRLGILAEEKKSDANNSDLGLGDEWSDDWDY